MTDIEFFERVIHTDIAEVPSLRDRNAAQFLMKMAALDAVVTFDFDRDLCVTAKTPLGTYSFVFNSGDDPDLVVDQVM